MIDFLGIGAQKAATTWLYEQLARHPDIHFPAGKETHYWDVRMEEPDGRSWLDLFPEEARKQGEITPAYAVLAPDRIERIRRLAPNLRLFFSLRNPVERAWSAALMRLRSLRMEYAQTPDEWFIERFRSDGSRLRCDYMGCLDNWLSVFPASQLHIILFDDIPTDPKGVLHGLAAHLGVAPEIFPSQPDDLLKRPAFSGQGYQMRPSLRAWLHETYDGMTRALARRIDRDLTGWLI